MEDICGKLDGQMSTYHMTFHTGHGRVDICRMPFVYSTLCLVGCSVVNCLNNRLSPVHAGSCSIINAEFNCTTTASRGNMVSNACKSFSTMHSPLEVKDETS